jgi:hypothetical protein
MYKIKLFYENPQKEPLEISAESYEIKPPYIIVKEIINDSLGNKKRITHLIEIRNIKKIEECY